MGRSCDELMRSYNGSGLVSISREAEVVDHPWSIGILAMGSPMTRLSSLSHSRGVGIPRFTSANKRVNMGNLREYGVMTQ